jgi:hypothetical protein
MKHALLPAICLLVVITVPIRAQEKPAKGAGKTLTFQPGAKVPDQLAQAATPAPKPVEKPAATLPAATPPAAPKDPAEIARVFFGLLEKNEIDAAYVSLTRGSKIAERPEELRALKTKTREAIEVFGSVRGYDLVERKLVGERLLRATYLSLGREFPLRWRFYFYKAEETWKLIDLRVDDKLTGIFEEAEEPKSSDKP